MTFSRKKQSPHSKINLGVIAIAFLIIPACFVVVLVSLVRDTLRVPAPTPAFVAYEYKYDERQYVTDFFTNRGAEEMIPIIDCESEFNHFDTDGTVLKNREGSNATGIAQIMSSVHPDPSIINRYNRQNNTSLSVNNFDINTLVGNVAYAYVLYSVRGTKDWECAKNT
jgi:hypothetical protein